MCRSAQAQSVTYFTNSAGVELNKLSLDTLKERMYKHSLAHEEDIITKKVKSKAHTKSIPVLFVEFLLNKLLLILQQALAYLSAMRK